MYYKHYCLYGYWENRDVSANDTQYIVIFYDGEIEVSKQDVVYVRTAIAPKVESKGTIIRWDNSFNCVVNDLKIQLIREYTYYGMDYTNVFIYFIDYGMYEKRSVC